MSMSSSNQEQGGNVTPLPPLRQDLRLIQGGAEGKRKGESEKRWKIHDPLSQRFFEVDREVIDLLALWQDAGTVEELLMLARQRYGRNISPEVISELIRFLQQHELLHPQPRQGEARGRRQRQLARRSWWRALVQNYLFLRLPLARPDRFLRSTVGWTNLFFRPGYWYCLALLGLLGLYLLSRQWERFLTTLPEMFSVAGVIIFLLSLVLVKTLHELGHGYTAVRMGSRVSTMGVALIVMFPVLYTDTTDAWRLGSRRQRVLIDAAGMAVELMVAVFATLLWVFLPDGPMRHAAFALATTGWVLSLLINLNPLMRFDGYYLFSDLLGIANLQERSFAMGRWWLREQLFGYGDPQPETIGVSRRRFLTGFAFATWLYRFFLFLGIALLVYHFFFKALGLLLFLVELLWFIALPIWRELRVWWQRRSDSGPRVSGTAVVALVLLLVLFIPLPYTVRIPAVLSAEQQQPAFAPRPARIEAVLVQVGQPVQAGQPLLRLSAPELQQGLADAGERASLLARRLARRSADREDLSASLVLSRELSMQRERIEGLSLEQTRLEVNAPLDGVVVELAGELHAGRWVDASTRLALVAQTGHLQARGYVDSEELDRIQEGQDGYFIDQQFQLPPQSVRVQQIAAAASEVLDNWLLASVHGGTVASRQEGQAAWPEQAVFEIIADVDVTTASDMSPITELRGEIQIKGEPQSLAVRMLRRVVQVLVRESAA